MLHAAAVAVPVMPDFASLGYIPSGEPGTRATLKRMAAIVKASKKLPVVRSQAVAVTLDVPNLAWAGEAAAVQRWVQRNIRYTRDVRGVETLQAPDYTLKVGAGDCDDHSMLVAAMLESIGHPTRFVAIANTPGKYFHVFTETRIGNRWFALETTKPWELGREPPSKHRLIVHN